jgi:hypothetical protein
VLRRPPAQPADGPLGAPLPYARLGVAAGAVALGVSSRGDALVLAVLLAVLAERPARVLGALGALVGSCVRWGTTTLGAIAGAQAVLGPAGWTGSTLAVSSAWAGAVGLVAATPRPLKVSAGDLVAAAPFGVAAAAVVAGSGPGGPLAVRVLAALVAVALGATVSRLRRQPAAAAIADGVALLGGIAAVVLAVWAR